MFSRVTKYALPKMVGLGISGRSFLYQALSHCSMFRHCSISDQYQSLLSIILSMAIDHLIERQIAIL